MVPEQFLDRSPAIVHMLVFDTSLGSMLLVGGHRMVYGKVDVELYAISATYWHLGLLQVLNVFKERILVPSLIKSFSL